MERGLIKLKIVAIQTSNPTVSFETVAFRFKIFNQQMKQKSQHNFNKNIGINICWSHLLCFQSSYFEALNSFKWIRSKFEANSKEISWELNYEFKVGFEVFNLVQDLVFSSLEHDPIILPTVIRATKKKSSHSLST